MKGWIRPSDYKEKKKRRLFDRLTDIIFIFMLGCSESNFVFSYENERRFSIRRVSNDHERSNSINLISQRSHELLFAGFASINAFIVSSSASTGLPESVVHLQHQNCRIEILQTSFGTGVLSIHLLHTHRIIFSCLNSIFTFSIVKK